MPVADRNVEEAAAALSVPPLKFTTFVGPTIERESMPLVSNVPAFRLRLAVPLIVPERLNCTVRPVLSNNPPATVRVAP